MESVINELGFLPSQKTGFRAGFLPRKQSFRQKTGFREGEILGEILVELMAKSKLKHYQIYIMLLFLSNDRNTAF